MSDPQIPAALAPAVAGIVSLHDFRPHPLVRPKSKFTTGTGTYAVTPADLATIYNFNPVFSGGNTGQNQTIYLIEDSDLYSNSDWTSFRSAFGLSSYSGASLNTVHPAPVSGPNNCSDPGVNVNGDDGEAILDAEYASAAAPSAAIVIASCANTATDGLLTAIQNLINGASPPAIISLSYGSCEALNGATSNAAYNAIYQQGVAEGTSIFAAAGDSDAGECDNSKTANFVSDGIAVSPAASTPYNVAVGGTDFSDTYSNTNSTYWNSTNTSTNGSAKSYIPEIPWNDSCAGQLIATFNGFSTTYGSSGFCNTSPGNVPPPGGYLDFGGGGGGPSGCATGAPSTPGVVSGTCAGYPKPAWQTGVAGIQNDGVRDLPDVSLFAADGAWGHFYIYCFTDVANGGTSSCTGAPSGWSGAGGTSFATPIWAGIQALVNQQAGGSQGNPNYHLYPLAAVEYGTSGSSTCNSSNGNTVGSSCIFYDVTLGDNDAVCQGTNNCYTPSGTNGVLSTSNKANQPAFAATTGWDFATSLGTVNVANLVTGWNSSLPSLIVSPPTPLAAVGPQGGPFTSSFSYTLSASAGTVNYMMSVPTWLTASPASGTVGTSGTTVTFTVNAAADTLPVGTTSATINFINTASNSVSASLTATLTVNAATATTTTTLISSLNPSTFGQPVTFTATVTSSGGTPAGTVTFLDGTASLGTGTLAAGVASLTTATLSAGSHTITASYAGTASFAASTSAPLTQTVNSVATTTTLSSSANPSTFGQPVTFTATVTSSGGTPTGTVTFLDGTASLGTGTLALGVATLTTSTLAPGSHTITASYGGSVNFGASTSAPLTQTVNAAATTTALSAAPNPSTFGQTVTFTATVTSSGGTPTGSVTFLDGTTALGTGTLAAGVASLTTAALAPGSHTITASYAGTAGFAASTSAALTQTVTSAPTTTTLSSSANPSIFGQAVTFTATVTSSGGTPNGGTVTFLDGTTSLGTGTPAAGVAAFTTSTLAPGSHTITASYAGTASFAASTSTPLTQMVNPPPKNFTVTVSTAPVKSGTVSGGGTFPQGSTHTVTSTPSSGYAFEDWTVNDVVVSKSASYTFTVTGNVSLVAHFKKTTSS